MNTIASLEELNAAPSAQAERDLLACCASRRWVAAVLAGRPFAGLAALQALSDAALAALDWSEIERALAAHPRIGQRAQGAGREADWSRREQSRAATDDAEVRAALTAWNVGYERRFGHVFLICATGLSAEQILTALRDRLANDEATERGVVRDELAKIVRLRLAKLVGPTGDGPSPPAGQDAGTRAATDPQCGAGIADGLDGGAGTADAEQQPGARTDPTAITAPAEPTVAVSTHVLDATRGLEAAA